MISTLDIGLDACIPSSFNKPPDPQKGPKRSTRPISSHPSNATKQDQNINPDTENPSKPSRDQDRKSDIQPEPNPPQSTKEKNANNKNMENDFNKSIDELANQIKSMFTRISDTGASHMTRTEAKEVLNRVYYRLVYSVRTKPRPKKNLFMSNSDDHIRSDGGGGGGEGGRDGDGDGVGREGGPLMKYFLKQKKEKDSAKE